MPQVEKVFTLSDWRQEVIRAEIVKRTPKRIYYRLPDDKYSFGLSIARPLRDGSWSRRFYPTWDSAKTALVERLARRLVAAEDDVRVAKRDLSRAKAMKQSSVPRHAG